MEVQPTCLNEISSSFSTVLTRNNSTNANSQSLLTDAIGALQDVRSSRVWAAATNRANTAHPSIVLSSEQCYHSTTPPNERRADKIFDIIEDLIAELLGNSEQCHYY
jgi:hypothetical protein